jgi:hypothetical protein
MPARSLDAFAATLVFALCIVWGFNQVAVKLALPDVGPLCVRFEMGLIELIVDSANGMEEDSRRLNRRSEWYCHIFQYAAVH